MDQQIAFATYNSIENLLSDLGVKLSYVVERKHLVMRGTAYVATAVVGLGNDRSGKRLVEVVRRLADFSIETTGDLWATTLYVDIGKWPV